MMTKSDLTPQSGNQRILTWTRRRRWTRDYWWTVVWRTCRDRVHVGPTADNVDLVTNTQTLYFLCLTLCLTDNCDKRRLLRHFRVAVNLWFCTCVTVACHLVLSLYSLLIKSYCGLCSCKSSLRKEALLWSRWFQLTLIVCYFLITWCKEEQVHNSPRVAAFLWH